MSAETAILIGAGISIIVIKTILKKLGYKIEKKRLKKLFNKALDDGDMDGFKLSINALLDFDKHKKKRKLDKYTQQAIKRYKEDNKKVNINEKNFKLAVRDFDKLMTIFDEEEEEKEEEVEFVDKKLQEIQNRRNEILEKRAALKKSIVGNSKKKLRRKANTGLG